MSVQEIPLLEEEEIRPQSDSVDLLPASSGSSPSLASGSKAKAVREQVGSGHRRLESQISDILGFPVPPARSSPHLHLAPSLTQDAVNQCDSPAPSNQIYQHGDIGARQTEQHVEVEFQTNVETETGCECECEPEPEPTPELLHSSGASINSSESTTPVTDVELDTVVLPSTGYFNQLDEQLDVDGEHTPVAPSMQKMDSRFSEVSERIITPGGSSGWSGSESEEEEWISAVRAIALRKLSIPISKSNLKSKSSTPRSSSIPTTIDAFNRFSTTPSASLCTVSSMTSSNTITSAEVSTPRSSLRGIRRAGIATPEKGMKSMTVPTTWADFESSSGLGLGIGIPSPLATAQVHTRSTKSLPLPTRDVGGWGAAEVLIEDNNEWQLDGQPVEAGGGEAGLSRDRAIESKTSAGEGEAWLKDEVYEGLVPGDGESGPGMWSAGARAVMA